MAVALSFVTTLAGCSSDEEKLVRAEEDLAAAIGPNKDDCAKMAQALTKLGESKGKEMQRLKNKVVPKAADAKKAFDARLDEKFAARRKAALEQMKGGMKCLLTDESVQRAMLLIEGDGESQPDRKPPEKASNGAPVTFVVDKLNPNGLDVSVYNFSDKTYGAYGLMIRYLDASGNPLKAKMSFKADFMTWSISGKSYRVPPKEWRSFSLDRLETPAGAVKAEIAVSSVNATDGIKIDQDFAFRVSDFEWPGAKAAR